MLITVGQVRSHSIVLYDQWQGLHSGRIKSLVRASNLQAQRQKRYSGTMTVGARKRLRKAIDILCQSAESKWIYNEVVGRPHLHKLSFITLTVSSTSELLTAAEAYKRLLRPFLQWATKYKGMKMYIWKAELQKRGQIHYHITTEAFIQYDQIRDKWNQLQKKEGLLNDYYEANHNYNPNSTDVHEVYKIKDHAAYLMKYLAKEIEKATAEETEMSKEQARTVGKVWDCSLSLKKAKYFTFDHSSITEERIQSLKKAEKVEIILLEKCRVVKCIKCSSTEILTKNEKQLYQLHLKAIRQGLKDDALSIKQLVPH